MRDPCGIVGCGTLPAGVAGRSAGDAGEVRGWRGRHFVWCARTSFPARGGRRHGR